MAEFNSTGSNQSFVSFSGQPNIFKNVYIQVGLALLYVVVFGVSLCGNMAVTFVVYFYWKLKSVSNFWVGNLAVANLAVSFFCIFQNLTLHLLDKWIFGQIMCKVYHFITSLWQGASILIHVAISFERYIFHLHPYRYRRTFTRQKLLLMTLGMWLTSALISFPSFFSFGLAPIQLNEKGDVGDICVPIKSMFTSSEADAIYFLLVYLVPVALGIAMYLLVGLFLRESGPLRMQLDEQHPRARNAIIHLRPSQSDGESSPRRTHSAPEDVGLELNSPSSSRVFTSRGQSLSQKTVDEIRAACAKASRKLKDQHKRGLRVVPTIELTPPSDENLPGCSTDPGVGAADCGVDPPNCMLRPISSRQRMLSRQTREVRRRRSDERRRVSTRRRSPSSTAGSAFSSNPQMRTGTAETLEAQRTLYRVRGQRLTRVRCKQRKKYLWMLMSMFLTFALLNFPHHACKLWVNFTSLNGAGDDADVCIDFFTFALMHANCAVDPIIYYAFMSEYLRACLNDFHSN